MRYQCRLFMILKRCVAFALLLSLLSFLPSSKAVFSQGTAQITDLAWSQDGSQLAVGRGDGTIDVVSRVGQPTATLSTGTQAIRALSWNPIDNNVLAASIYESTDVQILNIGSGGQFQIIRSLSTDQDDVRKIVWNKGGTQLATLGEAEVGPETVHTVQIWDTNTGNLLASYQDGYLLTDIAWNPQNSTQLLITGVADDGSGEILLWNAVNQTSIWTKDVTNFGTSYVAWNPDGSSFVVATNTDDSSPTQIYDSATGTVIAAIPTSHNPVVSVSWSPGSELALGGSNGIEVWNPATLQLITQVQPSDYGTIVVWSARNELAYDAGSSAKILTGLVGGATSTPTFTDTPTPTATVTLTPTLTPTNTPTPTPTQCSTASSIASNFNGTAIGAGRFIWFSSHFTVSGQGANAITISIRNQTLQFTASGTSYSLPIPDALVTIDPSASSATTTFDVANSRWVTTAPKGLSGDTFMTGLTFLVPSGGLPGGINPVTWSGQFSSNTAGLTVNWQWAAAVYTSFSQDYSALGVKPVDSNTASQYHNSDHAGTPENFKVFVIGGARGGGGSNYTGGNSGTGSVNPCH